MCISKQNRNIQQQRTANIVLLCLKYENSILEHRDYDACEKIITLKTFIVIICCVVRKIKIKAHSVFKATYTRGILYTLFKGKIKIIFADTVIYCLVCAH